MLKRGTLLTAFVLFWTVGAVAEAPTSAPASSLASATEAECTGLIIAELNNQPMYMEEILRQTLPMEKNLVLVRPGDTRWNAIQGIRQRYLDMRITERLFTLAAAADASVQASSEEIEVEYNRLVQQFGGEDRLEKMLGVSGEDLRVAIAIKLAIPHLRKKYVYDRIHITPKMKDEYYINYLKDRFTIPPQAAVRGLFRFADDDIEMASEEKRIREIRAELEEALRGDYTKQERLRIFAGAVRSYSEHKETRFSGGYWYLYGGHHIDKRFHKFEDVAFETPENVLSPVVALDGGFCILFVDEKRPGRTKSQAEAEPEIELLLQKEQFEQYQEKWMQSLKTQYGLKVYEDHLMCGVPEEAKQETAEPGPVAP